MQFFSLDTTGLGRPNAKKYTVFIARKRPMFFKNLKSPNFFKGYYDTQKVTILKVPFLIFKGLYDSEKVTILKVSFSHFSSG